jgi:hypothetical protein
VTAVVQHKIVLMEPDFAESAKLEVQQRLCPGRGGATAEPTQVEWRRHPQNITVLEEKNRQPVLTGLKRQLRPLVLGCMFPTASYPDLRVFDELRSTRPTPAQRVATFPGASPEPFFGSGTVGRKERRQSGVNYRGKGWTQCVIYGSTRCGRRVFRGQLPSKRMFIIKG